MDDLAANRTNQTVVKCIIDMCHSLQVECVAEGVENQEQLELLTSFGLPPFRAIITASLWR